LIFKKGYFYSDPDIDSYPDFPGSGSRQVQYQADEDQ